MNISIKVEDITIESITKSMLFHSGEPFVTSNHIANHFGVEHKNLLQKIRSFYRFDELVSRLKIQLRNRVIRGKEYPYYELDAEAFTFTCMSFTGKKAEAFKWIFIEAFKKATAEVVTVRATAQANLANEKFFKLREHGKKIHRNYTDAVKALCKYAEENRGEQYKSKCPYFIHIQKLVYKVVDINKREGIVQARDAFSPQLLEKIEWIEKKFADKIFDLIKDEVPYKEIYLYLKDIPIDIISEAGIYHE